MVHSDRGSQYCSRMYQALMAKHVQICSVSVEDKRHENAVAGSFFQTLMVETIHGETFANRAAGRSGYIEVDYNHTRRHSANGFIARWTLKTKLSLGSLSVVCG